MATDHGRFLLFISSILFLFLLVLLLLLPSSAAAHSYHDNNEHYEAAKCECSVDMPVKRSSFPDGFMFGAGTSAYQFEGAYDQDGKGLSIWDVFTHAHPEKIEDGTNGDVAVNFYSKYKEDVRLAKEMGLDALRFSISWSRLFPNGKLSGLNPKALEFYNNLIDELLRNGITPYATLFHWDTPLALETQYGGWLSRRIVEDFRYYADTCFKHFGNRVKHWITLNDPWAFSVQGYSIGFCAPGRCSDRTFCSDGDSGTEEYIVTHNLILAHATAVQLYRQKYQAHQNGSIGLTLNINWFVPGTNSSADRMAQKRAMDFGLGWYLEPLVFGTYPKTLRTLLGSRLPTFTPSESRMVKGSIDYVGLNYYSSYYIWDAPHDPNEGPFSYTTDTQMTYAGFRDGIPIGKETDADWLFLYPKGLRHLIEYVRKNYNDPTIYILENGVAEANIPTKKLEDALNDTVRIGAIHDHLCCLLNAIKDGGQIKGYFTWAFLDNYEWVSGYSLRFGLHYVDYENNLMRYPKKSVFWLKNILSRESAVLNNNIKSIGEDNSIFSTI